MSGAAAGLVGLAAVGAVAAGRHRSLPFLSAGGLVVSLSLSVMAVRLGRGLETVAVAALIGQLLYATGVLWLAAREAQRADVGGLLTRVLAPVVWCTLSVVVIGRVVPGHDVRSALLSLLGYLILIAPLVPSIRQGWRSVRS